MNAATHKYQRIKPQHLSNFINCGLEREREREREREPLLQIEFVKTLLIQEL